MRFNFKTLKRRQIILFLGSLAIVGIVAIGLFFIWAKQQLPKLAKNPAVNASLAKAVSKAMKVHGKFGPLSFHDWKISTPYFSATGWPGEAIGLMKATNIQAIFNPGAVLRGVWQLDRIDVASGRFVLRTPNDALKIQLPKEKRPWYASLMPQRFYCEKIECPKAEIEFPFQNGTGFLHQVRVEATMIGQDFKYFVKGGTLHFPLLPDLSVEQLNLFITRDKADIEKAILVGQGTNISRVDLQGRIGMREDKSISAKVKVEHLPFTQTLPQVLRDRLQGFISGDMVWKRDRAGKETVCTGKLHLSQTHLQAWPWLENIAKRYQNPDLLQMEFDQAKCHFDYRNDRFEVKGLDLHARDKVRLQGWMAYDWPSNDGEFSLNFSEMPLARWVGMTLKSRLNAELRGKLWWKGDLRNAEESQAAGRVILDGAELMPPPRLKEFLTSYSLRLPDYLHFERARSDFVYWNRTFQATAFEFYSPKYLKVQGRFDWNTNSRLNLNSEFFLNNISIYLPQKLEKNYVGKLNGTVKWSGSQKKLSKGFGSGTLTVHQGEVKGLKLLKNLSRFLKDDSFEQLKLERASVKWQKHSNGQLIFQNIDLLSSGKCGLKGIIVLNKNDRLSGKIKVGLKPEALKWLPEAETAVFKEKQEGLLWATVNLSGTLQKPREDLSLQIKKVLLRHPFALLGLVARGISWWLGNLFNSDP